MCDYHSVRFNVHSTFNWMFHGMFVVYFGFLILKAAIKWSLTGMHTSISISIYMQTYHISTYTTILHLYMYTIVCTDWGAPKKYIHSTFFKLLSIPIDSMAENNKRHYLKKGKKTSKNYWWIVCSCQSMLFMR